MDAVTDSYDEVLTVPFADRSAGTGVRLRLGADPKVAEADPV